MELQLHHGSQKIDLRSRTSRFYFEKRRPDQEARERPLWTGQFLKTKLGAIELEENFSYYLTRVLNLLNLAPSIQKHILALPPSVRMGPLTERSLRPLARSRDRDFQIKEFERLIHLNRKTSPAAA